MARIAKRSRKIRNVELMECCGRVCDQRCWETAARDRQFELLLSTGGILRVF